MYLNNVIVGYHALVLWDKMIAGQRYTLTWPQSLSS
jgi:hypothetical protein